MQPVISRDRGHRSPRRSQPTREFQARLATPFGVVGVRTDGDCISEIVYLPSSQTALAPRDRLAELACRQLERYLDDPRFRWSLPLARAGTPFQRRVWDGIATIAPGATRSYGELAKDIDSAARAVGQACGENPFPLVVPCHRVVAKGGLGGFAHREAGFLISVKRWLLRHEGAAV
jgi:methylated-DNA-[protein]-cysteine S-methyltransferase